MVSAVFANNSRVLQQWSINIENTHIKACVHHEGRMPYTAWSDKHLQVHSVKQLGLDMLANFLRKFAFIQKGLFPRCGLSHET